MIKIRDILAFFDDQKIDYSFAGDKSQEIETFCPLSNPKNNGITWARNPKSINNEILSEIYGLVILVDKNDKKVDSKMTIIFVENVHKSFFRVIQHFFCEFDIENKSTKIESNATVISKNIGENVYIGYNTYIGPNVIIGNDVNILHNVTIDGNVTIGDNTTVESGSSIGVCGFGYYVDDNNHPICVPHLGGVKIGNNVKIGANNCIARGCLDDTVLEDFVKTDNLCHIAHNVHIKKNAMITANSVISGSVEIGENVWLGPGSLLINSITVGDNSFFGIGTVATKNIEKNKVVVGIPARVLREKE